MSFRRSIMIFKNFASGAFEQLGAGLGHSLPAANFQRKKVAYLTKTFSALNSVIHNSFQSFQNSPHDLCKRKVLSTQLISSNVENCKEFFVMPEINAVKQQRGNPKWLFGTLTSHILNPSNMLNTLSVSRSFTTHVQGLSRTFALETSICEVSINCIREKHSLPKVPPTRMMSVYDIERTITDEEAAKEFVYALKAGERKYLYEELARFHGDTALLNNQAFEPPNRQQLKLVMLHQMFPFIGFGFLDNCLMIVAGEYIDMMLGTTLGISTMAAAALGNWFSDVCGLGSAHYVENFVTRFGIRHPHLSPAQVDMKSTKWASNLGKVIGVTIGCFLGMIPLLFFNDDKKKTEHGKHKQEGNEAKE